MKRVKQPRVLLVKVVDPHCHAKDALAGMSETTDLVKTFGGKVAHHGLQHRVHPHSNTYIGSGKVRWLKRVVKKKNIDIVVMDDILNSGQLYRLERSLWDLDRQVLVWDRVDLILHIFERHAATKEAQLQIELARLEHTGPRVYGLGKDLLSRQAGGIGTRGIGETNIEREKRILEDRKVKIERELEKLTKQRHQRIRRRKNRGFPTVAMVGYTSAGKTTLFNALTKRDKKARRSLFTTLDSVVGRVWMPALNQAILLSDTIGFIENLPPVLVDAFRSTLLESMSADVLLHVIDASDPRMIWKMMTVQEILSELEAAREALLVFNKIDALSSEQLMSLRRTYQGVPHVLVSAKSGEGLDSFKSAIQANLAGRTAYALTPSALE